MRVLLKDGEIGGRPADVLVVDQRIEAVGTTLATRGADEIIDAAGGAIIPGLHDHHVHLLALASARTSVTVGPPQVNDRAELAAALRRAGAAGGWIRAIGYHEVVAGDLDRRRLDELVPTTPTRVQHRSGALWVLSSAAIEAADLERRARFPGAERDGEHRLTGRFWRCDDELRALLGDGAPPDLGAVSDELLRYGVTGTTDATPSATAGAIEILAAAARSGALRQRVVVTGAPRLDPAPHDPITWGPAKIVIADHADLELDHVTGLVRAARRHHRAVAIHAVSAAAAAVAVAAIEEVGTIDGDRMEHGAVLPIDLAQRLAVLGITVVTNPSFVGDRGDEYLTDVEAIDRPDLWRCRSLLDAGVRLAAGTDAPFGDANPWRSVAAAVERKTRRGAVVGGDERIEVSRALDLFLGPPDDPGGPPRRVSAGAPADLLVLPDRLDRVLTDPGRARPTTTIVGGSVHRW